MHHIHPHPLKHLSKALAVLAVAAVACLLALAGSPGAAAASDEPPPASQVSDNPSEEAPSEVSDNPAEELKGSGPAEEGFDTSATSERAQGWNRCPEDRFCIFEHANGEGRYAYFRWGWDNLGRPIGGFNFNDETSSVWNRTIYKWCVFKHAEYNTVLDTVWSSVRRNLSGASNDNVSSLRLGFFC